MGGEPRSSLLTALQGREGGREGGREAPTPAPPPHSITAVADFTTQAEPDESRGPMSTVEGLDPSAVKAAVSRLDAYLAAANFGLVQ